MVSAMTLMTACGGEEKTPEQLEREAILTENLERAPKIDKEVKALITESYGTPVELTEEDIAEYEAAGEELPVPENSLSPGEDMAMSLASYSKEELMKQKPAVQINIFVNGVIRDEYSAAATTLYGAENVQNFKKQFKKALLANTGEEEETTYVDRLGTDTAIQDGEVAKHYVDDVIKYMNRTYVDVTIGKDFGDRVTVDGSTFGIQLDAKMDEIDDATNKFLNVPDYDKRYGLSEEQLKQLNDYHKETFPGSLATAMISDADATNEIGGFEINEEGLWVPSNMESFAYEFMYLVYLT